MQKRGLPRELPHDLVVQWDTGIDSFHDLEVRLRPRVPVLRCGDGF